MSIPTIGLLLSIVLIGVNRGDIGEVLLAWWHLIVLGCSAIVAAVVIAGGWGWWHLLSVWLSVGHHWLYHGLRYWRITHWNNCGRNNSGPCDDGLWSVIVMMVVMVAII